jgi:hypothetical protein
LPECLDDHVAESIRATRDKVERRTRRLRDGRPFDMRSRTAIAGSVEAIRCANIRGGFAVADAYRRWTDATRDKAVMSTARGRDGGG